MDNSNDLMGEIKITINEFNAICDNIAKIHEISHEMWAASEDKFDCNSILFRGIEGVSQMTLNILQTLMERDKIDCYKALRAEINKQKTLRDMTNNDLAKATHLAESTINGFMGGKRYSELVDRKLRDFLGIPENLDSDTNG